MAWATVKIIAGLGTFAIGFYFGFIGARYVPVGGYLIGSEKQEGGSGIGDYIDCRSSCVFTLINIRPSGS